MAHMNKSTLLAYTASEDVHLLQQLRTMHILCPKHVKVNKPVGVYFIFSYVPQQSTFVINPQKRKNAKKLIVPNNKYR